MSSDRRVRRCPTRPAQTNGAPRCWRPRLHEPWKLEIDPTGARSPWRARARWSVHTLKVISRNVVCGWTILYGRMDFRRWIESSVTSAIGTIIATGLIAGAVAVYAFLAKLPGPVVLVLFFAVFASALSIANQLELRKRMREMQTAVLPTPPEASPKTARRFFHGEFCWIMTPIFFENWKWDEQPSDGKLDTYIKGPHCTKCGKLVRRRVGLVSLIEDPCTSCGRSIGGHEQQIPHTKRAVYGESKTS